MFVRAPHWQSLVSFVASFVLAVPVLATAGPSSGDGGRLGGPRIVQAPRLPGAPVLPAGNPCEEPSAVDQDPTVEPLRIEKLGAAQLTVTWEAKPGDLHALYQGELGYIWERFSTNHTDIGACELTEPVAVVDVPGFNSYYLAIEMACDQWESSYGRDSLTGDRESAWNSCP